MTRAMTWTRARWWTVAAVITIASAAPLNLAAQQRDRPATEATRAAEIGTASVSGMVTLSDTSEVPVRRAIVMLVSAEGGDATAVVTDDQGRFAIQGIPEGRYSLGAKKPAHLTNNYGAKRPGRPGVTLVIAAGQQMAGLRIVLPRGGVITGRLTQPSGRPMRNTQVVAVPISQATAGGRLDFRAQQFLTDDQGVYRIYGLAPDEYMVAALPAVGRGDVERRTAADYEDAVRSLTQSATRVGETQQTAPPEVPRLGYAPTYYPGTPVPANAAPVRVNAGDVREGIDIPITMFAMSSISGTVRDVNGQPTQAVQLSAEAVGPPMPISASISIRTNRPDPEGHFTITNVPPGFYRVTARGGGVTVTGTGVQIRSAEQTDWAMADVQVTGEDIEGVALSLQPGMTFSGRIEASGTTVPETLKGVRIALSARGAPGSNVVVNGAPLSGLVSRSSNTSDDGSFTVTGLQPAEYEVVVTLPSALAKAWAVRSVAAAGVDLRDRPMTFADGSIGDVTITLTDQRSEIAGTLSTSSGAAASDFYIVVFPADRSLWHPLSPRVRVIRPNADGAYSTRDLLPGDYRIAAVTDVEDDEWRKASFLESLLDASLAIVVKEGATTRQDLRIQ